MAPQEEAGLRASLGVGRPKAGQAIQEANQAQVLVMMAAGALAQVARPRLRKHLAVQVVALRAMAVVGAEAPPQVAGPRLRIHLGLQVRPPQVVILLTEEELPLVTRPRLRGYLATAEVSSSLKVEHASDLHELIHGSDQ